MTPPLSAAVTRAVIAYQRALRRYDMGWTDEGRVRLFEAQVRMEYAMRLAEPAPAVKRAKR